MLGLNPAALVTLCIDCHQHCEFNIATGKKLTHEQSKSRTLYVVANKRVGIESGSSIGLWYKNRWHMNQETSQRILTRMDLELPEWAAKIRRWLEQATMKRGPLRPGYPAYLGILPREVRKPVKKDPVVQRLKKSINRRVKK